MLGEPMPNRWERAREIALAASVGVVLADSSIVTLGLPDVLREFDASVVGVSWVLTAFNLALALAILPAVRLGRQGPSRGWAIGLTAFALASLGCALAPSEAALIGARVLQALGGALTVVCAIELLARDRGSHELAAPVWAAAGTIGVSVGPAAGGLLTELLSWQAIFLVQVPLLLALPLALRGDGGSPEPGPEGEPDLRPEVALALLSAGLTAALFLLVILLTEGWALSPLAAAATVSAIPVAAFAARRLIDRAGPPISAALAGGLAIAGGLAALGVLPGASFALTLQPQILIGVGLALALPVLTFAAVGGRDPDGSRAAATIAARHAGIVLGIVILAPLLSTQLESQRDRAQEASTSLLLDAPLPPDTKVSLAEAISAQIEVADGKLPQVGPAFDAVTPPEGTEPDYAALETGIEDQVQRAATNAFSLPFLGAAAFALLALIPIARLGTTPSERPTRVEDAA